MSMMKLEEEKTASLEKKKFVERRKKKGEIVCRSISNAFAKEWKNQLIRISNLSKNKNFVYRYMYMQKRLKQKENYEMYSF